MSLLEKNKDVDPKVLMKLAVEATGEHEADIVFKMKDCGLREDIGGFAIIIRYFIEQESTDNEIRERLVQI